MDVHRSKQLQAIIQLSKEMLAQAKENGWERVAELEAKRRDIVLACFQQTTPEQDSPEVAAAIREILRLNQEVADLGRQCREHLGAEIHTQKVGRAASAAYLNCTR